MKKLLLILCLLATVVPGFAEKVLIGNLYYNLNDDDKTAEVTYDLYYDSSNYSSLSGDLVIPETVEYNDVVYTVTSIGEYAFYYATDYGYTGWLTIPETVTYIADHAFDSCHFGGQLTIPNSVTYIGKEAFRFCYVTSSLNLGNSVTYIGDDAFFGCSYFKGSLILPESVTYIGKGAFSYCRNFTGSLTIPEGITSISEDVFYECTGFNGTLTLPESLTSIGNNAFYRCSGLRGTLTIPESVTYIGDDAFSDCSGFYGTLIIPDAVTYIGKSAFFRCTGFTDTLAIPASVTTIGGLAFWCCSGLKNIVVDEDNPEYASVDGILYDKEIQTLIYCPTGYEGSVIIPESVITIYNYAFEECKELTGSITIPDSVTSIGNYAFSYCTGLSGTLTLGKYVTSIGYCAFRYCKGLTGTLTLPETLTSIGEQAFKECSGFTGTLTIPDAVTYIGGNAFQDCSGFTGTLTIPESVTTVSNATFKGCSGFTAIELGRYVKEIGTAILGAYGYAFDGCSHVESVTCHAVTPPKCYGYDNFYKYIYEDATLYVPAESVELYANANVWEDFKNVVGIESDSGGVNAVSSDAEGVRVLVGGRSVSVVGKTAGETVTLYDMNGSVLLITTDNVFDVERPGIYVVKVNTDTLKIIVR